MSDKPARSYLDLTSPLLHTGLRIWRSRFVLFLLWLAYVLLAARALWVQGLGNTFYIHQSARRLEHLLDLPPMRGQILDQGGVVLATSLPVQTIWANPREMTHKVDMHQLMALSRLLALSTSHLTYLLQTHKAFVYLKHLVPLALAEQIKQLNIPGVHFRSEYRRFYPEGVVSSQLVGFTNAVDSGQDGIELSQDKLLQGSAGSRMVIKDRLGNVVEDVSEEIPVQNGQNIALSINSKVQYIAYQSLKDAVQKFHAADGSAVVIDVASGNVLAMANYPSFDPNNRADLRGKKLRNRVMTDQFEPGSLMKPFTIALALDLGRIFPNSIVNTGNGVFKLDGAKITDDSPNGMLSVTGVLQKSSNIGATKIALMMKPEQMWDMFTDLGFGVVPKLGFPGAAAGMVRPWQHWRRIEQATMSYGYGISASLFQLARAYSALANDGKIENISLFQDRAQPVDGLQTFTSKTAAQVREMLEAVTKPGGTSPNAAVVGYRVGGKSGTAYKHTANGYDRKAYRASFVGMAPMPHPRIVVAVSIDNPTQGSHFGGSVSGPVFSQITGATLRLLNVLPNIPFKSTVVVGSSAQENIQHTHLQLHPTALRMKEAA